MGQRTTTEVTLIDRCRKGDHAAFDILVDRYRDRAYRVAFRLTRDAEEAEDIVAEAFVRVFRGIEAFSGQAAFGTWLYRILTNCFLDKRRNPRKPKPLSLDRFTSEDGHEMEIQIASSGQTPFEVALLERKREKLVEALERIPPHYKTIIMLYHAEMFSYEEIAEVLEMPVGTVKSRLNRARLALRELLSPEIELLLAA